MSHLFQFVPRKPPRVWFVPSRVGPIFWGFWRFGYPGGFRILFALVYFGSYFPFARSLQGRVSPLELWHFGGSGDFWILGYWFGFTLGPIFTFFGRSWNISLCNMPRYPYNDLYAPPRTDTSQEKGVSVKNERDRADHYREHERHGKGRGKWKWRLTKSSRQPRGFRGGGQENAGVRFRRDLILTCGFLMPTQGDIRVLNVVRA